VICLGVARLAILAPVVQLGNNCSCSPVGLHQLSKKCYFEQSIRGLEFALGFWITKLSIYPNGELEYEITRHFETGAIIDSESFSLVQFQCFFSHTSIYACEACDMD
jgi:hypothetical protein